MCFRAILNVPLSVREARSDHGLHVRLVVEVFFSLRIRRAVIDPRTVPLGGNEQSHLPPARGRKGRWLVRVVPDAHFPMAPLPARERPPLVDDVELLRRDDLAAVPQRAAVSGELGFATGDENAISTLSLCAEATARSDESPTEARASRVDP